MGRNQNTNTNRNFGSLLQPSWMDYVGVQHFSKRSNCRCGRKSKKSRIRIGA